MSGTTSKIVPEINLDEFEKRLRAAGAPSTGIEDPLAELTRLVNAVHSDARRAAQPTLSDTQAAPAELSDEPESSPSPPPFITPLRPAFAASQPDLEPELEFGAAPERSPIQAPIAAAARPPQPSRGWSLKVAGFGVLGLALLGGAWALRHGGVPGLATTTPPFIAADDAPTKVQPPSDSTVQSSGDIAALLMKDSTTATPVKVVNNEEQPLDLRTQTQPAAPGASPAPAMVAGLPVVNAPDTPVVPPAAPSTSVAPMFPAAKPVKTVSVRPDGTLIPPDAAPVAAPPIAAPTPAPPPPAKSTARAIDAVVASPDAATPKVDLPTKLTPPKSPARVVAKTDTTAPADATDTTPSAPLQLAAPRPVKPTKPAPAATVADAAPADPAAPAGAAGAATPTDEPNAAGEGAWAVQLSAPRSEADAKSAITRLKSKYAEALGDSALGVHEADVKGETIYRVRVTGLSRSDAGALCAKLKASGGDCFVAKD
jgi:hypothetical protein